MSERIIPQADLTAIERGLSVLAHNIAVVGDRVDHVESAVQTTHARLNELIAEFHDFVEKDQKAKQLQLAETRLVKVRQELESQFGHYGEVRRSTVGILQAMDVSLVRQETIRIATEEMMLKAPRYWLAPCLVTLSAWIGNNQPLADRALSEALRRDSEKTCLFFALVSRRGGRYQAARTWLERYFSLQNPEAMDRELVVLLDAYVGGLFGPDADGAVAKRIGGWLDELSQQVGFVEEQHRQWVVALESKLVHMPENEFPYLHKYSPTWPALEQAMQGARLHAIIYQYFENLFSGPVSLPSSVVSAIDDLLDKLVTEFDEEELPLRQNERLLTLIVEADGDKPFAEARFAAERTAVEEKVSLTQRLTDWGMHPETSHASKMTQRFSIALCRSWITAAHDDITAKNRAEVPLDVELKVEQWTGSTRDGENETELLTSADTHITQRLQGALAAIKLSFIHWAALVAGGIVVIISLISLNVLGILAGGAAVAWWFFAKQNVKKQKETTRQRFEQLRELTQQIVRAACAEVVDYRRQYAQEDANADNVTQFLSGITPEQCVLTPASDTHLTMGPAGDTTLASQFPEWNVVPAVQIVRRKAKAL